MSTKPKLYTPSWQKWGIRLDIASIEDSCGNVFKDLGFSDSESANLTARCELLLVLQDIIKRNGWTQSEAAKNLNVGQPRIAEIIHSQSGLFSVDLLIKYLARLAVQVNFKFSKLDWKCVPEIDTRF